MLANSWDEIGVMRDVTNDNDSVVIEPVEEETKLILNFYASQRQFEKKNKLIENRAYASEIVPVRVRVCSARALHPYENLITLP